MYVDLEVVIALEQTSSTHLHFIVGKQDGIIMANNEHTHNAQTILHTPSIHTRQHHITGDAYNAHQNTGKQGHGAVKT